MVWYGIVWYGMIWYGMLWNGMAWCCMGVVWYGILWHDVYMVWNISSVGFHRIAYCLSRIENRVN
jgi:hypothetical protein